MDTERMACPQCGTVNPMLAVVEDVRRYVCRSCGEEYYTPNSCLGSPDRRESERTPPPGTPRSRR